MKDRYSELNFLPQSSILQVEIFYHSTASRGKGGSWGGRRKHLSKSTFMAITVSIATFKQINTAYYLKEKLEEENIDCYFSTSLGGEEVRLRVKDDDVERAIQVMLDVHAKYGADLEAREAERPKRKIIVLTDFSQGSEYACQYAIHLAHRIKGEIKILHVFDNPVLDLGIKESSTYLQHVQGALADAEKSANAELMTFDQKMKDFMKVMEMTDVRMHSNMIMGKVLAGVKKISDSYEPDFIVMGTLSSGEGFQSMFGDLADSLVLGLKIPLYAIPGPVSKEFFRKINVLYATDFNEKDHHSLECLLDLLEPFDKKLSCIHVETAEKTAAKERVDELNAQLEKEYGAHEISCVLNRDEDVFSGITSYAIQNHANLLSFTVQKRRVFQKLFKPKLFQKILKEAGLPLLLFPS